MCAQGEKAGAAARAPSSWAAPPARARLAGGLQGSS